MSIAELKKNIIDKVNSTTDVDLLEDLTTILEHHRINSSIYHLSDLQIEAVNKGLEEFKKGNIISNDDLNREIDEWLNKE